LGSVIPALMATKIIVETIPHDRHRYPTLGDWWFEAPQKPTSMPVLQIRVSEMLDPRDMWLVAALEFVEAITCLIRGIREEDVTKWDKDHPEADEPGALKGAPYHDEHVFAENIERQIAHELGRDWQDYEDAAKKLFPDAVPVAGCTP
jgi:hypothetical protein